MKALVALLSVAAVSTSHALEKRSLLGVGQDHQHHEHHEHHEEHEEHERTGRDSPVSAPAGYLPPAEDDYGDYDDDSAGFGAGKGDSTNNNARGFDQQAQASEDQQSQYGQNAISSQSDAIRNSLGPQSANGRNQRVKFGQRINQNFKNTGLRKQQGSRRKQQGRGRNQNKAQRNSQFDLENDQDGPLGTYGNEIDQILNNQQEDRPGSQIRQENNQRVVNNFDDSTDQSQYAQNTGGTNAGPTGKNNLGQPGQRRQFGQQGHTNENQTGRQRNNQFGQGHQGNGQGQSGQFSQGGKGQQKGQGQENSFGNQQLQSADAGYGAPGQGKGNNKSQIGQNQRGQNQRGQSQIVQNRLGQNERGQNHRGPNQRGQNQVEFNQGNSLGNQQVHGQPADESYGAPGQGQNSKSQNVQNQRGQSERGNNQTGQNNRGQPQRRQNQRAQNKRGQTKVGLSQGNQQVQGQSADRSYGAPVQGPDHNNFQIGQTQRGQPQKGETQHGQTQQVQNLGGQNDKRQTQRSFPSEFDSSIATRPTINRFLPSSQDNQIVNNGYRAPPLSGQNTQGQNGHGGQSDQNSQRSETGGGRYESSGKSSAAQTVQPGTGRNGFPFSSTESNDFEDKFQLEDTLLCPGGNIESCIKVCPGNTALLYGGCVQGCAERCDAQGQGLTGQNVQEGQQGQPITSGQAGQSQGAGDQRGQYGQQTA